MRAGVSKSMTHIVIEDAVRVCDAGQAAQAGPDPSCALHRKDYEPNPGFTRNSWLQPYVLRQS